jgi:hypothetical protein
MGIITSQNDFFVLRNDRDATGLFHVTEGNTDGMFLIMKSIQLHQAVFVRVSLPKMFVIW